MSLWTISATWLRVRTPKLDADAKSLLACTSMARVRYSIGMFILVAAIAAGCGQSGSNNSANQLELPDGLKSALAPEPAQFPDARGKTLAQLVRRHGTDNYELLNATSLSTVGPNRFAFAIADKDNDLVFGPTAVYVADGRLREPARGPFLAPADLIGTDTPDPESTNPAPPAVYSANLDFPKRGRVTVFALTQTPEGFVGAATAFIARPASEDRVVRVGEKSPAVDTGVPSPARIDEACTRNPPDSMHKSNFADVVGKRPVALVIATPAFCESRVCGPVVDVAERLRSKYGGSVEFIHSEVYNQNDPKQGLRSSLKEFGASTEPWLFTFDRSGRVAARLEGAFGARDFESAVRAAL